MNEAILNSKHLLKIFIDHGLNATRKEFESGSVLSEHGESPLGLFFITSGQVRTFLPIDARMVEIEKIGPGRILGLPAVISDKTSEATAVAEGGVKAVFISKDDVLAALRRDPRLYLSVNSFLSDALSCAYKHIRNMRSNAHRLPA
jgi:CRP-like cAMP-binding protein